MKRNTLMILWVLLFVLALMPLGVFAADSYQIGEQGAPSAPAEGSNGAPAASSDTAQGPVRLARFSYVQGNITWRPSEQDDWSPASVNLPIRQGAQIWVTDGGRAEIQFDDGSMLRLGNGAIATLQTLYSDTNGEFTEIKMSEGLCALRLRHPASIYQIDTPFASIKSDGPSKVRVGVDNSVEIAVRDGSATVEGGAGKVAVEAGSYLDLTDSDTAYQVGAIPSPDGWDRWNDDRDQSLSDADSDRLPPNIALVAGDLDDYGVWHTDPRYGSVWCPTVVQSDWRPYQHGHWVWVEPFGWTWVSSESWGWAPYHYGTWVNEPYGWAWVPGPATQYWCPAVVHFSEYRGAVAWAPLAPVEVRYPPALRIGFRSGNWSLFFSIGGAAVYYPANDNYCSPRPWSNRAVNRVTYVNRVTNITNNTTIINNTTVNRNVYLTDTHFVPQNARTAAGVTTASAAAFGGSGDYQAQPRSGADFFVHGRGIGAPQAGARPFAGPIIAHRTALAYTASRTFLPDAQPAPEMIERPVFRAHLPTLVARMAPRIASVQSMPVRPNTLQPGPRPVEQGPRPAEQRQSPAISARDQAVFAARNDLGQTQAAPAPRRPRSHAPAAYPAQAPAAVSVRPVARTYHYSEATPLDARSLASHPKRITRPVTRSPKRLHAPSATNGNGNPHPGMPL